MSLPNVDSRAPAPPNPNLTPSPSPSVLSPSQPTPAGDAPDLEPAGESLGRRSFLKWVSGLAAATTGVLVGIPVVRALVSPAIAKPPAESWVKVADDVALLDLGVPIRVDFVQTRQDAWVETRTLNAVWLYTDDGETFVAYNGHCTHLGCGFGYDKDRKTFVCPCHRGQFDVKSGAVLAGPPPRSLDRLEVRVRESAVYVNYRDFRLGLPQRIEA